MPKEKKIKTHVLLVSKAFLSYHPKAGEPTGFRERILSGQKIHTIRGNYPFWKKRIDEVAAGQAVLSLRQWSGKPYKSAQEEFLQLTSNHKVGIQKITVWKGGSRITLDGNRIHFMQVYNLCVNDGVSVQDFKAWMKGGIKNGCVIHFSEFRYKENW